MCDNRGVMDLNFAGSSAKLAFAMTANGNAQLIEFDAFGRGGNDRLGNHGKSRHYAYSTARITGDYTAICAAGFDNVNNRAEDRRPLYFQPGQALSPAQLGPHGYGTIMR